MDNIQVSIICLTYNHENYIKQCLDGFINQKTSFNYEVIVHDDASTDSTKDIILEYAKKYRDLIIPIIQQENLYSKGINIVHEIIMPKVRGKYVAFCEGDDAWIDFTKLEQQVTFLESHSNYSACVHNTIFRHCGMKIKDFPMFVWQRDVDLGFKEIMMWSGFGYQTSSLLTRKALIKDTPPFGYSEFPLAVYLSLEGKIHFIAKNMSLYRFRSGVQATRANVFDRNKMINEYKESIAVLTQIKAFVSDDEKKLIVDRKILGYEKALINLQQMTDDTYRELSKKKENKSKVKFVVRAYFSPIYALIKRREMEKVLLTKLGSK